ncbi:MAG: hypothetical protein HY925_10205, partial [Elusimicrobia bacterium]|nr:hypothetical protein [Elusimicrobiota bacterium]
MARDDDGIPVLSPGECWIAALWTEGVALFVLGLIYDISAQDLSFFPCTVYAVGFCGLALFFAASVPSDGGSGTFLSPAALALMRVVPSPGLPIRLAAIVACVIPCFIWEWGGIDSASIWVFAFAGTLFVVTLLHGDRSAAKAGFVDNAAPCLMVGLTGAYGLSTWALYPADASYGALGMTLAGGAQLFLLRHAAARHWTALAVSARQERGVPDVTIPIEAYSTETELAVPAAPAASPAPGSGPTLVESGTFRIDA